MMMPEYWVEMLVCYDNEDFELRIYCDAEQRQEIFGYLRKKYLELNTDELLLYPAEITDYGFKCKLEVTEELADSDEDEDDYYEENSFGMNAYEECLRLDKVLKDIKKNFPSVRYEGYIVWDSYNESGGETSQFEFSSEKKWQEIANSVIADILSKNAHLSKCIDETEVFESFGKTSEFIRFLYVYRNWISNDDIEEFTKQIEKKVEQGKVGWHENLDIVKENLSRFKNSLKTGEPFIFIEDDAGLPDGYMEAIEMFAVAEEISGKKPKQGEIVSSVGSFDLVTEKAESGDAAAKFTAGKYYIAAHIEEERDRAIRWIREAAEAGEEDAVEYMDEHRELFR